MGRLREGSQIKDTDIAALLRRVSVFASLNDAHIAQLTPSVMTRDVAKGELVTVEGQPGEAVYIFASGHFGGLGS